MGPGARSPRIESDTLNLQLFQKRMRRLRRHRWVLWLLLLGYVPMIWISLEVTGSDRATFRVFAVWVATLFFVVLRLALVRCPRCNKHFHLNGFIPLYLRRCLHCGLHVSATRFE